MTEDVSSHEKPYVLYNRLGSGGFVVEAVLELAQVPFKLELIESKPSTPLPAAFRAVNPWGQVPVLETPQGGMVTEAAAILFYLADRHASVTEGPNLFVTDKAAFFRWTVFLSVNVYEGILRRGYPERYLARANDLPETAVDSLKAAAFARNHAAFRLIEDQLARQAGLCGAALSPTDIFCAMLYAWHNAQPDLPRCTGLTQRVANHPRIAPIWRKNFDHRLDRKWAAENRG